MERRGQRSLVKADLSGILHISKDSINIRYMKYGETSRKQIGEVLNKQQFLNK